jgi:hypothetical protein
MCWPVFDTEGGLEELELGGDAGAAPLRDLVQVHQRRPANQLLAKNQRLTKRNQSNDELVTKEEEEG